MSCAGGEQRLFSASHQPVCCLLMSSQEDESEWTVECSDEETYNNVGTNRQVERKTIWEPSGKQIAFLYQQLEKTGCIDLRWQCPGRRSPSVHSVTQGAGDKKSANANESNSKVSVVTEFDFDEEFADTNAATAKLTAIPNRRKTGNQTSELFRFSCSSFCFLIYGTFPLSFFFISDVVS